MADSFAPNAVQDRRLNMQQQPYQPMYQQNEQAKKAQSPQGAQGTQQPAQQQGAQQQQQTFQQMRMAGTARPPQPAAQQYAMPQPQQPAQTQQAQQAQPVAQSMPAGQMPVLYGPQGEQPTQGAPATPNGFNGQGPNFNPLDYYIGQAMGAGQSPALPQFQQYTPQGGVGLQAYGGFEATPINFQGGVGGVDTNINYNPVDIGAAGNFAGGTSIGGAAEQQVRNVLAKPSGWDSELLKSLYGSQGAQIDDQYAAQDTAINEEMARRGIYDSSIAAGRLKDSSLQKRDAKTRLSESLLQQMGLNLGADNARAAQIGSEYQGQQFGEGQSTFNTNEAAKNAVTQQQMQQAQNAMQADIARSNASAANAGIQLQGQGQQLQAQQYNAGNALNAAQLNSQNTNAWNSAQLQAAGLNQSDRQFGTTTNNNNAQQQYNNQFGAQQYQQGRQDNAVGQITNYGQQQFNNDMTQQQFNAMLQNQQFQQYLASLGMR